MRLQHPGFQLSQSVHFLQRGQSLEVLQPASAVVVASTTPGKAPEKESAMRELRAALAVRSRALTPGVVDAVAAKTSAVVRMKSIVAVGLMVVVLN